jgi:alpha-tubulin suppressor-like RCC1 family protein
VGDFHTLMLASGCNCFDPVKDRCLGQHECNGGANLYSWGFNMHGQVNGVPTDKPVLLPQIVPFFVARKQVKLVAACRARSIAVTSDNEVYEWGFTGSEGQQFQLLHDQLPEEIVDVKLGTEFNLFLAKSGTLWVSGAIT